MLSIRKLLIHNNRSFTVGRCLSRNLAGATSGGAGMQEPKNSVNMKDKVLYEGTKAGGIKIMAALGCFNVIVSMPALFV
jgi:hypothetical protein